MNSPPPTCRQTVAVDRMGLIDRLGRVLSAKFDLALRDVAVLGR
jgi:hypothetical protein